MSDESSASYVYADLGNEEQSVLDKDFEPYDSFNIRVIELEPAAQLDAELQCKIEHVDVSKDWKFAAVSYVWGPPVFSETLTCLDPAGGPDTRIALTATLNRVLRRFRKTDQKRRLWADAVCINQKDSKEKNQQVQRMAQIYRYAMEVLVWLGDAEEMDKCINFLWGLSSSRHESAVTADRADESIKEELGRFFGHTEIDAVRRFLDLPWFRRRWVVQEALPKKAHFFCGSLDITSHALDHAVFVLKKSTYDFDQGILDHIQYLEWEAKAFEHPDMYEGSGILDLLVRFNRLSCASDHDRIYAYLGLANDVQSPFASLVPKPYPLVSPLLELDGPMVGAQSLTHTRKRIPIQVAYDQDVKDVYTEFAEQMLQQKDHLELFHCAGAFRPHAASMSSLYKSWVPNWKIPMRYRPFISVPWFKAGFSDKQTTPFFNYPWCSVEGFVFDTVKHVIPFSAIEVKTEIGRREMPPVECLCSALGISRRYVTGERMWQVLGLTWIADHGVNHEMHRFYSKNNRSVNGKLVKRNASERDMHTFLDWWAKYDQGEGLEEPPTERNESVEEDIGTLSIDDAVTPTGSTKITPSNNIAAAAARKEPDLDLLMKQHGKSTHRHNSIGSFLKPSHTAGEWGPTSYEKQSGWHSRTDEELEPYELAFIHRLAEGQAPTSSDPENNNSGACRPEDEPYDCEWRHQNGGFIWLDPHARNEERYAELAQKTLQGRALFLTSKGYIGIGPDDMEKNDTVAILHSARTPFILRQAQDSLSWCLLGDSYVHGIMAGEAMQMDRGPDCKFVIK
jgi:Heterokaryon incompatibility protein (HET)